MKPDTVKSARQFKDIKTESEQNPTIVPEKPHKETYEELLQKLWERLVESNQFGVFMTNARPEQKPKLI